MCKTDSECARGETCSSGTCSKTAAWKLAVLALLMTELGLIILLSGCAPSMAQLEAAGYWVAAAQKSCPANCAPDSAAVRCVTAVAAAAQPAAGRKEYTAAAAACKDFGATP